jgi:hypothetical protein
MLWLILFLSMHVFLPCQGSCRVLERVKGIAGESRCRRRGELSMSKAECCRLIIDFCPVLGNYNDD